jgi:16S rRNA (adenine1518-N6/adenine1519-N6)-dimethyltransferase
LLQLRGLTPNTLLGQNFLIDANIRDIILHTADPRPEDVVLEVGPGLGVLTEILVEKAGRVIAVEKDRGFYEYLKEQFPNKDSLSLILGDALDLDSDFFKNNNITKLVSNLPYSVGSRILMNVFCLPRPPERVTVTLQLEVAERLSAAIGAEARGLMGVWAQRVYRVETVKVISPSCFCPRPKVKSAVVLLRRLPDSVLNTGDRKMFARLTKESFVFRRKQLATILARVAPKLGFELDHALTVLETMGVDPRIRPEMLEVGQWQQLADGVGQKGDT